MAENEKEQPRKIRRKSVSKRTALDTEFNLYLNESTLDFGVNPLMWWKTNKQQYPNLASLAPKFLSAPPSSVESERLFSIGGNIITSKRGRLTAEHGERLMFLNFNLRAFNFEY